MSRFVNDGLFLKSMNVREEKWENCIEDIIQQAVGTKCKTSILHFISSARLGSAASSSSSSSFPTPLLL
ncbi:hypothetical protein L1987_10485 [Smallanthus sonchifolius]|uniref:Uncharacterized protein n=1 Tax=Smallanthus sonchifolius TaxID=185202 RepID=A0ACB9JS74_9ASTR|nr:hypothetical protein L1987_10485 [Smallanthus sonchifolius]